MVERMAHIELNRISIFTSKDIVQRLAHTLDCHAPGSPSLFVAE